MTSTNTTIETRHDRRITVDYGDETTVLEIVNTTTGRVLGAGLTPVEARQIAAALTGQDGPWFLPDLMWLRADLAKQPPAGQWTREDLPSVMDLVKASVDATAIDPSGGADAALDAVVAHLNAHHPKPEQLVCDRSDNDEPMMPRETLRERVASDAKFWNRAYAEGVASAERTCNELRSLIEGQKEHVSAALARAREAERQRDDAHTAYEKAGRERDAAVARAEQLEKRAAVTQEGVDSFDVPPPPVTTPRPGDNLLDDFPDDTPSGRLHVSAEDIVGVIRGRNLTTPREVADAVMELLSGSDPAVFVVRESDLPEVERTYDGWSDGTRHGWEGTAETAMECVETHLEWARFYFAAARAIEAEATPDPVEALAEQIEHATRGAIRQVCEALSALAPGLDPLEVERAMEVTAASRALARHVLAEGGEHDA